ncbi:hypothetical protein WJX73_000985 [Symbiochloris irregularis]|uniref:Mitochondrial ribosomal protein L27 n=1 Tax=Symbiochloris irregularis TaxID=706552 RepID=A0AAW1PQS0_9CHLO
MLQGLIGLATRGRRVPRSGWTQLTGKVGPKNFYKGKGVPSAGKNTSKGAYVVLDSKLPNLVVPDLTGFKLKPYIAYEPRRTK